MRRNVTWRWFAGVALFAALPGLVPVRAQSSGGPYRIDSVGVTGGGSLGGGAFRLLGTLGQPLTGAATASAYAVRAGFLGPDDAIFRNGFEFQ